MEPTKRHEFYIMDTGWGFGVFADTYFKVFGIAIWKFRYNLNWSIKP